MGGLGIRVWIERANCEPFPEKTQQFLHPSTSTPEEIEIALKDKFPVTGMNRQQLIKVLGNPKSKSVDENNDEVLIFEKSKTVVMELTETDTSGRAYKSQYTKKQSVGGYRITMRNDIAIRVEKTTPSVH
jgi:hypothetical protein